MADPWFDERPEPQSRAPITPGRVIIWVLVVGFGIFMVASGIVGIFVKGQ